MIGIAWATPERSYQQDEQVDERAAPLLMSADNPGGWKLEELLERVRRELAAKNAKLVGGEFTVDADGARTMRVRTSVRELNEQIITKLVQATLLQQEVLFELSKLGPDQGPHGKPRLSPTPAYQQDRQCDQITPDL